MKLTSFVGTLGLGALAGAATVLMMPKQSQAYQMANDAAKAVKQEAGKMLDSFHMS